MSDLENSFLMIPGPVRIHPRVLRVLSMPAMPHRSGYFKGVIEEIKEHLKYAFKTDGSVALISGSGSSGMESVIASVLHREDRVLNLTNGKFGERFYNISKVFAKPTQLKFDYGNPIDLEKVRAEIKQNKYRAITLCHNETSTGVTNQLPEICEIAHENDLLMIADLSTSLAGIEANMDKLGIDLAMAGSQKCIAGPAGLSPVAMAPRVKEMIHHESSFYLNLGSFTSKMDDNDTPWTPAVSLYQAYLEALRMLREEGLENRIKRTTMLADLSRAAVDGLGLELFATDRSTASNTVTAIKYPKGVDDTKFRNMLRDEFNIVIAGGQATMKGKIFRIGHMGICTITELMGTYTAIEVALRKCGYTDFKPGASTEAFINNCP